MNSVGFMQKWDTLGALCAAGAFLWRVNRSPHYWMCVAADEPAARRTVGDGPRKALVKHHFYPSASP